ncbi:MAG TPA: LacI family DNA-binding transcriptional regulator, partial [Candidatus Angelobacter sp.]|nr:LacI family DNA-binding transcriptional regulator [Candidatus Angelobacter sp.]
ASQSGYSASTVSIVLNEAPLAKHLRAATRQRIHEVAERLGYRPHVFARSLRSQRSNTIGIVVFDLSDPFCTLILRGVDIGLQPTEYLPVVMDAHNDRNRFGRYLEMLADRRVEGLIVVANWLFVKIDALESVVERNLPTIVVGRDLHRSGIRSILVDNEAGGYLALKHLFELGHRDISFILGPKQLADTSRRWAGMQRFLREADLSIQSSLVKKMSASLDPLSGFTSGADLTNQLLKEKAAFTAIAAFDDMTAFGAIRALTDAGRHVPRDCSVVGFDDVPMAALASPSLTTIRQPMLEMGTFASATICDQLTGKAVESHSNLKLVYPTLEVRQSTQAL